MHSKAIILECLHKREFYVSVLFNGQWVIRFLHNYSCKKPHFDCPKLQLVLGLNSSTGLCIKLRYWKQRNSHLRLIPSVQRDGHMQTIHIFIFIFPLYMPGSFNSVCRKPRTGTFYELPKPVPDMSNPWTPPWSWTRFFKRPFTWIPNSYYFSFLLFSTSGFCWGRVSANKLVGELMPFLFQVRWRCSCQQLPGRVQSLC